MLLHISFMVIILDFLVLLCSWNLGQPQNPTNFGVVLVFLIIWRLWSYLGWWTTMQMFTPSSASRLSALRSCWEDALSKPDVGSSKINSEGSITISNPTLTLFLWPPEIPRFSTVPTREFRIAWSPKDSITLSTTRTLSGFSKSTDSLQKSYFIHKTLQMSLSKIDRIKYLS